MSTSSLFRPALHAMRATLVPALVLQLFAVAVVLGYFRGEAFREFLDDLGHFKTAYGYAFSAVSTGIFGGLLPFFLLWAKKQVPPRALFAHLTFYVGFWVWKGMEVDAFYRLQTILFGESSSPAVIVGKTLFDQFVYNPLWAAPTQAVCFLWKDCDFSLAKTRRKLREKSLLERSLVILLSTWIVWIPSVAIIYTLPSPLQLPLFNLVLCFWCLMLSFVSREQAI